MKIYDNFFKQNLKKINISYTAYSFLFINLYLNSQKKHLTKKHSIYFIYNSISFNIYKKNLNKKSLLLLVNNNYDKNNDLSSMGLYKKHINFGKLTWYWIFQAMSKNRFLLNYKEYKNYFSKNFFIKYEINLLNYEKNFNKWSKFAIKHLKNTEDFLFSNKINKTLKKLYVFRLKANKHNKLAKYETNSKKICFLTNTDLIHKDNFLRFYRKPYAPKIYSNRVYKRYWKSKKFRIIGLNKWKLLTKKKIKSIDNLKKKNLSIILFTKSIGILSKKRYYLKKNLWNFKSARSSFFKSISTSFTRKNILNNPIKIRGKLNNNKIFFKKNKTELSNLFTGYLFPKSSIDLLRSRDFENIPLNNNNTNSHMSLYSCRSNFLGFNNLLFKSVNKKFYNFLKRNKKLKLKKSIIIKKKNTTIKAVGDDVKNIINKKQSNYLNKKIENSKISIPNKIIFQKNLCKFNKNNSLNKNNNRKVFFLLKKNKIFINFFYNSKIKIKLNQNNFIRSILFFKFDINKKKLNQIITNILMGSFFVRYFFNLFKAKLVGSVSKNIRLRFIKFMLKLNKYNSKRIWNIKNKIKKKFKKQEKLRFKKKRLDLFKKEYSWKLSDLGYNDAIEIKKEELINEKRRMPKVNLIYDNNSDEYKIRISKKILTRFKYRNFKRFCLISGNKNIFRPILGYGNSKRKKMLVLDKKFQKNNILFLTKWKNSIKPIININSYLNLSRNVNLNRGRLFLNVKKILLFKKYNTFLDLNIKKKIITRFVNLLKNKNIKKTKGSLVGSFLKNKKNNYSRFYYILKNKNNLLKKKYKNKKPFKNPNYKLKKLNKKINLSRFGFYSKKIAKIKTYWHLINKTKFLLKRKNIINKNKISFSLFNINKYVKSKIGIKKNKNKIYKLKKKIKKLNYNRFSYFKKKKMSYCLKKNKQLLIKKIKNKFYKIKNTNLKFKKYTKIFEKKSANMLRIGFNKEKISKKKK